MKIEIDLNDLGCGIAICKNDSKVTVLEANDAFYRIIGYSKQEIDELFENKLADIAIDDISNILNKKNDSLLSQNKSLDYEFRIKNKDGKIVYLYNNVSYDKTNDIFQIVTMDITEKEKTIEVLKDNSRLDEVTKLPNPQKFRELALELLLNNPKDRFIISKIDINNFDIISEIFGTEGANKLLRIIGDLFKEYKFNKANISRTGVDEFIIIISMEEFNAKGFEKFNNKERLYTLVEQYIPTMIDHKINFSVGTYKLEKGNCDIDNAINKASMAHKCAKNNNSSIVEYSNDIKECSIRKVDITNRMEEALRNKEFTPYFQPQYDINTKKIIGAEALTRWTIDEQNIYCPNIFVPIFEKNGFIIEFDMFMLEYVCEILKSWLDRGYKCVPISVNFSKLHFVSKKFVQEVISIVDRYSIPHELIIVEMTETALIKTEDLLVEIIKELQTNQFKVAIDDFGSGYSSLSTLKDYPFNILKLDKGFFSVSKRTEKENNIIKHVIDMTKSLGMKLVAEGIESEEQVEWLQTVNCEIAQGYYFSHPITAVEFRTLLNYKKAV